MLVSHNRLTSADAEKVDAHVCIRLNGPLDDAGFSRETVDVYIDSVEQAQEIANAGLTALSLLS